MPHPLSAIVNRTPRPVLACELISRIRIWILAPGLPFTASSALLTRFAIAWWISDL